MVTKGHKSWSQKLVSHKSHIWFLKECSSNNIITYGLRHECKLINEDENFLHRCQRKLNQVNLELWNDLIHQLSLELKDVQKNYHRTKRELIQRLGDIEAGKAFGKVKSEMNRNGKRLEKNIKRKLSRLLRAKDMELVEKDTEEEYKQKKNSVFRNCRKERYKNRREKRKGDKTRKRRYKKRRRKVIMKRKEEEWIKLLSSADKIREDPDRKCPLDRNESELSPAMISLMSEGQKFVPVPGRINLTKKYSNFLRFCQTIRLAMLFKDKQHDYDLADAIVEPWILKSSFQPEVGGNEVVENFLAELYCKLFDSQNRKKVKPDLSREEKLALSELKNLNRDTDCPRVIRIQDKGSKFVIDWKSKCFKLYRGFTNN